MPLYEVQVGIERPIKHRTQMAIETLEIFRVRAKNEEVARAKALKLAEEKYDTKALRIIGSMLLGEK